MEKKHAMLAPSGAHRWMQCIGAPAMEMGLPDKPNEYSDEGTCAHAVALMCLTEGKPATAYIGRLVTVGVCRTYEFSEDMAEPVQCYVDMVNSLPGEKHYEVPVPIGHLTGEEGAEGTADVVSIADNGKEVICVDLKFGMGVFVKAERNKQGMTYALGALRKFNLDLAGDVERVRIMIHQPRISEAASEWDCTLAELLKFGDEVASASKAAMTAVKFRDNWIGKPGPFEYLTPGEEQCKFCKALGTCPAAAAHTSDVLGADFDVLAAIDPKGPGAVTALVPVDVEALALRLTSTGFIEDWIKAVRAEVERRLLAGEGVPGYKIVQGRQGNRKFSDLDAAEKLMKSFRLRDDQIYKYTLNTPTVVAEKLAPKLNKDGTIKEVQPAEGTPIGPRQWPKLASLIVRSEGAKSVAPTADPRPAITINPLADHEVLDASDLA